jgi:hypothetical protein
MAKVRRVWTPENSQPAHQKGEKVMAIIDNNGSVLAPLPVAPVNETDMVLLPEGLKALQQVAKEVGLDLRGAYLNLDGAFDAAHDRKCIFHARITADPPRGRSMSLKPRGVHMPLPLHFFSKWVECRQLLPCYVKLASLPGPCRAV